MAKPTVLIVEDEILLLELAGSEFEEAGYNVLLAQNAEAAMARIEDDTQLDLLFTDIRMPGQMDGWELARRARAIRPQLRVIYTTGYTAQAPVVVEGALVFSKPYHFSKILSAAQRLI